MKELILITSHTPDNKREELLRKLVKGINNKEYDIMVVSHTSIPKDIMDGLDYFIFDKKNPLLFDINEKAMSIFENENFTIHTTETKKYNHGLAFLRLLKIGLTNAKKLNYKKVHFFEYDSLIKDFKELQENSELIESLGVVCYKPTGIDWPNSPMSFNLEKISELWFELSDEGYYNFMFDKYSKISEEYQMYLIKQGGEHVFKNVLDLKHKGIDVGLYVDTENFPWFVIVYDMSKNKLVFFGWNESEKECNIKVISNNSSVLTKKINPKFWTLIEIGVFDEINHIMIVVNDNIKNILDFNLIERNIFKQRNFLKTK